MCHELKQQLTVDHDHFRRLSPVPETSTTTFRQGSNSQSLRPQIAYRQVRFIDKMMLNCFNYAKGTLHTVFVSPARTANQSFFLAVLKLLRDAVKRTVCY